MTWLGVLQLLLSITDRFASYMHNKQLMDAGAAQAVVESLRNAKKEAARAQEIRDIVDAKLRADPSKLRDGSDPFQRDGW